MQILEISEAKNSSKLNTINSFTVGIDFGTTNSLISFSQNYSPLIIPDERARELIPSTVTAINDLIVGSSDIVSRKIRSIKRLLGKSKEQILNTPALAYAAKDLLANDNSNIVKIKMGDRILTPPLIVAEILKYLKKQAERYLDTEINQAVITVPAYFDSKARGEIILAAKSINLEVVRLIAEPTAAAYAYGLNNNNLGCYLVYDLGGGTFDVSILRISAGVLQVIATNGDNMLGGDDIDSIIADHFKAKHHLTDSEELLLIAKQAKELMATTDHFAALYSQRRTKLTLDKETFEQLITTLIKRTINIMQAAINQAGNPHIDGIILVGGSTRISLIKKMLNQYFPAMPILDDLDVDKVVAFGAALQAENLTSSHKKSLLIDVLPLSIGMELYGGSVEKIILKDSPIPLAVTKEFTTFVDNQTAILFHITQGEREMAADCRSLAKFELLIPAMKAGGVKVDVKFSVDADGILSVSAFEKVTNNYSNIEIKVSHDLSNEEIQIMLEEAYKSAASDHYNKLLQESRVEAELMIYYLENTLVEASEMLEKKEIAQIQAIIITLKNIIKSHDREQITKTITEAGEFTQNFMERKLNYAVSKLLQGKHIDNI